MRIEFIALTMALLLSATVRAQVLVEGSAEAGAAKAITCSACHGPDGNSVNPLWPSIAGQHPLYIVEQLQAFKNGTRSEPLMLGQAMMLSDEDMRNLAVYYSQKTTATKVIADPATLDHGQRLYRGGSRENQTPACIACHGPNGRGNPASSYPSLKGQYAVYIAKQLRDYASGARRSDGATRVMRDIAAKLSEEDIVAVSSYVQGLQ
ncbi:MAG: c-type cytochrome [Woeseiaceae bacterium]|nr:c-type cytochrome [Woeseiaceae bacterium]